MTIRSSCTRWWQTCITELKVFPRHNFSRRHFVVHEKLYSLLACWSTRNCSTFSFIHSLLYLMSIKRKFLQSKYVVNEKSLLIRFLFSEELTGLLHIGLMTGKLLQSTRYHSCLIMVAVVAERISSTKESRLYLVSSVNSPSHFGHTR